MVKRYKKTFNQRKFTQTNKYRKTGATQMVWQSRAALIIATRKQKENVYTSGVASFLSLFYPCPYTMEWYGPYSV
jgi:hypothetical protein